jgi:hypothetical protein
MKACSVGLRIDDDRRLVGMRLHRGLQVLGRNS